MYQHLGHSLEHDKSAHTKTALVNSGQVQARAQQYPELSTPTRKPRPTSLHKPHHLHLTSFTSEYHHLRSSPPPPPTTPKHQPENPHQTTHHVQRTLKTPTQATGHPSPQLRTSPQHSIHALERSLGRHKFLLSNRSRPLREHGTRFPTRRSPFSLE